MNRASLTPGDWWIGRSLHLNKSYDTVEPPLSGQLFLTRAWSLNGTVEILWNLLEFGSKQEVRIHYFNGKSYV